LRKRGIVRPAFLDGFLRSRLGEHAGYYGELVWTLMMLEEWMQAYAPDYELAA
jgi:asparagine synthase (glutamine-hydrolysing)